MAVVGGITGGLGELLSAPTIGGYALAGSSMAISTTTVGKAIATAIGAMVVFSRIGKSGGYRIDHHYPNDHDPMHVHVSGDDIIGGKTKVDLDGIPLPGQSPLTSGAKKAFKKLYKKIIQALLPWM